METVVKVISKHIFFCRLQIVILFYSTIRIFIISSVVKYRILENTRVLIIGTMLCNAT